MEWKEGIKPNGSYNHANLKDFDLMPQSVVFSAELMAFNYYFFKPIISLLQGTAGCKVHPLKSG